MTSKNFLGVVLCVFLAIIIGVTFVKMHARTQEHPVPSQGKEVLKESEATAFTRTFYTWYLTGQSRFDTEPNKSAKFAADNFETQRMWLSPEFYDDWWNRGGGSNPIIQAQDYGDDWWKNIIIETISENTDTAKQKVTFGMDTNFTHSIFVNLKKVNGRWYLDSTERLPENNLK